MSKQLNVSHSSSPNILVSNNK